MNIADSMMADAHNVGVKPLSLDGIRRAAPAAHKWASGGTNGATTDQHAFYNLLTDTAESGATLGTPVPSATGWTAATVARYIADNPSPLRNVHFSGASVSTLLEQSTLRFVRKTPDVSEQVETIFLSTFVHDMRYQTGVLSIPINGEVLDGYTFPRFLSPGAATAPTFTVTFSFGATNDKRADVPGARAAVVAPPR